MLGKFIECEANKNDKYYRVIQTIKEYSDGRRFPIDEIVESDIKVDVNARKKENMGGFCISTYDFVFRWLIRGDTLCEVKIPEDSKIYKTCSENGLYISDRIILTNPRKIDDDFALELYDASNLTEISYFRAMAACALCGYRQTAFKVLEDKVNKENAGVAYDEFVSFCERRVEEKMEQAPFEKELVRDICNKLEKLK